MLQETGTKRQNHICGKEHGMIGVARSLVSRSSGCLKEAEAREVHGGQILQCLVDHAKGLDFS